MNQEEALFLKNYDSSKYPKPSVTADIAIFAEYDKTSAVENTEKGLKVLLIQRGGHPCKGMYALPGGFSQPGETVDETAARELKEETHIDCDFLEQLRVFSEPGRDPRGWTITCAFLALIDESKYRIKAGDDANAAEWFDVEMEKNADGNWELRLTNGSTEIYALTEAAVGGWTDAAPKLKLIESENIAFDHGLILSYAVLQLRKWQKEITGKILAE